MERICAVLIDYCQVLGGVEMRRCRHWQGTFHLGRVRPKLPDRETNGSKRSPIEEADGGPLDIEVVADAVHDDTLLQATNE